MCFCGNLEYYEGILFLTTNQADDFDDAILSRIQLKIKHDNQLDEGCASGDIVIFPLKSEYS